MTLIEKLKARIQKLNSRRGEVLNDILAENDAEKRTALGQTLQEIDADIADNEAMLADAEAQDNNAGAPEGGATEERGADAGAKGATAGGAHFKRRRHRCSVYYGVPHGVQAVCPARHGKHHF